MANHYYGVTIPGAQASGSVTKATSTTSKNVELVILDGVTGANKVEVLKALEAIANHITTDNAPA
jgi:alkaline phosphatase